MYLVCVHKGKSFLLFVQLLDFRFFENEYPNIRNMYVEDEAEDKDEEKKEEEKKK